MHFHGREFKFSAQEQKEKKRLHLKPSTVDRRATTDNCIVFVQSFSAASLNWFVFCLFSFILPMHFSVSLISSEKQFISLFFSACISTASFEIVFSFGMKLNAFCVLSSARVDNFICANDFLRFRNGQNGIVNCRWSLIYHFLYDLLLRSECTKNDKFIIRFFCVFRSCNEDEMRSITGI